MAIDRAIKIAELLDKNEAAKKWEPLKKQIKDDIENKKHGMKRYRSLIHNPTDQNISMLQVY